ncbi:class I SAM-dependent methyltransferase [Aerosticca soli]|uniref:Methyltransferase n=1 Tax=Aerosticca soli TaxID=2010829 RepID=A0A2Z6E2W3_9GAMM|nr:class I SAM-dependent methyltransferase [Aerosticca soli]BBD79094.1 methyltransferase [Aerosticca soli]
MSPIHPAAAQGYAVRADAYASGRPGYPPAVQGWLRDALGLGPGKRAVDLGAGTGKFTPNLRATGAYVLAVEPVAAMRAQLQQRHPGLAVLGAAAEHLPLPDACVDAVVCAQSFHWFANPAALAEIRRVLKPGGALGLIWNVRDERVDWVAALAAIVAPCEGGAPRYHSQHWRKLFPAPGFGPLREQRFAHGHRGPPAQVILERTRSVSFIAALAPQAQQAVMMKVQALIDATPELAGQAEVVFPYETMCLGCRREH